MYDFLAGFVLGPLVLFACVIIAGLAWGLISSPRRDDDDDR